MASNPPTYPGTIADVIEQRAPLPAATRPALEPVEDLGEVWQAGRVLARSDRTDADAARLEAGYEAILDAVNAGQPADRQFRNPGDYWSAWKANPEARIYPWLRTGLFQSLEYEQGGNPFDPKVVGSLTQRQAKEAIFAVIRERRAKDPGFLPGVPDTAAEYDALLIEQEKAARAEARSTLERSSGVMATLAQFGGGARELIVDPVNVATLPVSLGGEGLAQIAIRSALLNGAVEAMTLPQVAENRELLGEELTTGEALTNVGTAAAFGGLFPVALHGAGKAGGAGYDFTVRQIFNLMPEGAQAKWAARMTVDDMPIADFYAGLSHREAAEFARDTIPEALRTPAERAAINALDEAVALSESSPYAAGPAGDRAHASRIAIAISELTENRRAQGTPPDGGGAAGRPPPGVTPGGRPPLRVPGASIVEGEAAIAAFKAKVRRAESGGDDAADNPKSSAQGRYQFTDDTFVTYYQRVIGGNLNRRQILAQKFDAGVQERLMDALSRDNAGLLEQAGLPVTPGNLYLLHFLGPTAIKVLKADPARPIAQLVPADFVSSNPAVLGKGQSASEVIAWAHGKMGGEASSIPARPGAAASEDPRVAQLREEALRLNTLAIGETALDGGGALPPMRSVRVDPDAVKVDAERFQFKSGGDEFGVTDRLRGVTEWNPIYAGRAVLWEDMAGNLFIADGHQRLGLARRIQAASGNKIEFEGMVLREADGVTAETARTWAALKNIAEGTGTAVDAAKVIRQVGAEVLDHLPPRSALVRDGAALSRLSDEAFGAVYNDVIAPDIAAVVGHLLPDRPDAHGGMVELLVRLDPPNRGQAESIVRQAIAAGFHKSEQVELFGAREITASLFLERAKVLERGLSELRKLKGVFGVAARNADTLEAAGSTIARTQAEKEAARNAQALEIVSRLAFSKESAVADALNAAAAKLAAGARLGDVVGEFVATVRKLDLADLAGARADDSGRLAPDGAGRGGDAGTEGDGVSAGRGGEEQPSLLEMEAATERFSDPDGQAMRDQADSLVHDLAADVEAANRAADAQGNPLLLFRGEHGARDARRLQTRHGSISFTADRTVAETYAQMPNDRVLDTIAQDPRVVEAFLDIRKPVIEDAEDPFIDLGRIEEILGRDEAIAAARQFGGWIENTSNWMDEINGDGAYLDVADFLAKNPDGVRQLYFDAYPLFDDPAWVAKFKAKGYDGAIHGGNGESALTAEYKVFDESQVRFPDEAELARVVSEVIEDPAIAARARQEIELAAAAPLRGENATGQAQDGTMGLGLFDRADQPELSFRLDEEGPERSAQDLLDELDADEAAIAAIKGCL